jgi:carbon storage regulator
VLILTRKVEQGIVIDEHTRVRVLSIDGERVKIGIEAPKHITVLREELLDEVVGENREAARRHSAALAARLRALKSSDR